MKKYLLSIICFFTLTSMALAAPVYLVCDAPPAADKVTIAETEVTRAGTAVPTSPVTQFTYVENNSKLILIDITDYQSGPYIFKARFIGEGGMPSDWSDPFSATKPAKPGNLAIK